MNEKKIFNFFIARFGTCKIVPVNIDKWIFNVLNRRKLNLLIVGTQIGDQSN